MNSTTRLLLRVLRRTAEPYLRAQGLLRVNKIFNKSALEWQPSNERVVVLAPHMDDEVIGCGGTVARHVAAGSPVTVIFLTDGGQGGVTASRKREAGLALAELGVRDSVFLDAPDGRLAPGPDLVAALRSALTAARPQILYLPFFLEEHPDHRAASALLAAAMYGTPLDFQCHGYEVWTPLFPNCLVRIDDTLEIKRRAIGHYQSQLKDVDYLHTALGLNAYRSSAFADSACRHAEAFCAVSLAQYLDLYRAYGGGK